MEAGIFLQHQHKCVMSIPLKYCDLDPISLSNRAVPGTHLTFWDQRMHSVSSENSLLNQF